MSPLSLKENRFIFITTLVLKRTLEAQQNKNKIFPKGHNSFVFLLLPCSITLIGSVVLKPNLELDNA